MTDLVTPLNAYQGRAANVPAPEGFVVEHNRVLGAFRTAVAKVAGRTFYNDISEFQRVVNSSYPHSMISTRIDTGGRLDYNIEGNRNAILRMPKIQVWQNYVVFIPGASHAILSRFKNFHGKTPPKILTVMIDMEAGAGFAGPGNHSTEANWLAGEFADYLGSQLKVCPYANGSDYANNWPQLAAWLKPRKVIASYGSSNPGGYAWQYYGGLPYGSPSGFPRSNSLFGSHVDYNVINKPISQIVTDFGVKPRVVKPTDKDWSDMATKAEISALIDERIIAFAKAYHLGDAKYRVHPFQNHLHPYLFAAHDNRGVGDRLAALEKKVK